MNSKTIDVVNNYAVMSGYQLITGISGTRTRQTCGIFVSGFLKGKPGCLGNISNTKSCLIYAVMNSPALAESFHQECITMKTTLESIRSGLHPRDLVHQSTLKLNALHQLLYYCDSTEMDVLNSQDVKDGLFMLFTDIKTDLSIALDRMEEGKA